MKLPVDYSLYLVTDRSLITTATLEEAIDRAIRGGCTIIQLREKTASSLEFFESARRVKAITDCYGVPLIINDRVDIALAVDAAGVHVGQSDLPADTVRRLIGPEKLLGVSASTLTEAQAALQAGADYLGVGAMFPTDTKTDGPASSLTELKKIRQAVSLPLVVIGGINKTTLPLFREMEIDGLAVVSAILGQPCIEEAARDMKESFLAIKKKSW